MLDYKIDNALSRFLELAERVVNTYERQVALQEKTVKLAEAQLVELSKDQ